MKILLFIIMPALLLAQSPSDYVFDPLVVVADRYQRPLSELNRSVTVLEAEDIRAMTVHSVPDILAMVGSVDMQRRGQFGVQGDVSVRGGSYESTLILIDGVKVNDPQTAHHNMDIPLTVDQIERIEILHGSGSALYGADAGGGVINIVTGKRSGASARIGGGQFGLLQTGASVGGSFGTWHHSLSASMEQSDGFTDYTDFKTRTISYGTSIPVSRNELRFFGGWVDKKFGANNFYSSLFPNQREHTSAFFYKLQFQGSAGSLTWAPRFSYRRHKDDFILDNARPNWYRNKHASTTLSFELPLTITSQLGQTVAVAEVIHHSLASSNLGDHERSLGGAALSHKTHLGAAHVSFEGYAHYFSRWGWKIWPAVNVGYSVGKVKFFAFAGKSFRIPSFTELYYKSPANIGNPDLTFSETLSAEFGQSITWSNGYARWSLFARRGNNQIDWSRSAPSVPWQVNNVGTTQFNGIDADLRFYPAGILNVRSVAINAIYMTGEKTGDGFEYKYALNYLEYGLSARIENRWPGGITSSVSGQWKKRKFTSGYILLDISLAKQLSSYRLYVKASNLLGEKYFELVDVPAPGRWLSAGIEAVLF